MKHMKRIALYITVAAIAFSGCHKQLDKNPPNALSPEVVYKDVNGYKQVLAKVYGSMALTGNQGPAGNGDVAGINEGTSDFLRLYWKAQELSTDEAVVAWNDPGIQDFHNMNWSSSNPMLIGLYGRCMFTITLCNEFIRESAPDKVAARGLNPDIIKPMRAEARFVRAFQYWVLMDLFGNPAFADETQGIGKFNPEQANRQQLFSFIERELQAIEADLPAPRQNEYGRADRAAAWALLARMYLNAESYGLPKKYTEAITYSKRVIDAFPSIASMNNNYRNLFLADNHANGSQNEFIWTLNYDGLKTQNYGGTTFLVNASVGGDMSQEFSGLGGWGGIRTTRNIPLLFPDFNGGGDKRAQFFTGHNLEINSIADFKDGFGVQKFRNRTSTGGFGNDPNRTFADVDFPIFRLAEMYLIYAEAVHPARGGTGGSTALAINYLNQLRSRAQVTAPPINSYDLDYILAERGRELYWEGHRRTDLIRFNRFTEGTYLWPWKGGVKDGVGVDAFRKIYPIPAPEVASNPNMRQNPGY